MYGYKMGDDNDYFEIKTVPTSRRLNKGEYVVVTRRDSTITLGCDLADPCKIEILGEE